MLITVLLLMFSAEGYWSTQESCWRQWLKSVALLIQPGGLQFSVNVQSDGANPPAQDIGTVLERDGKWYLFFRCNGGIALVFSVQ